MNIFTFSDSPSLLPEILGGAKELVAEAGGTTTAIIIGSESEAKSAFSMGADKIYWLGELRDRLVDDFVPTIAKLVNEQRPTALLVAATMRGKSIAGRIAAALNTAALVNVKELKVVNGSIQVSHMIYGGGAIRVEQPKGDVLVATVGAGLFAPINLDSSCSGQIETVDFIEPAAKISKLESKPKKSSASNITAAKRVVGVGRGFAAKEDLKIARELANVLGGEVGYTRPVTEGDPPFAEEGEPYIGVSGIQIKPDLYIAVGISGQTQHIVGVNESRIVVCINNEPKALMFRYSDYGIVGDLYEVLPELSKALKGA
ncbi:MAG TPA: electron transfer flavoprotein subunit alpha/FixB family protein [Syntrophomonadaceae bacterium]|nr:electron transfer flavoprotein subunit alpha/FixB family protein [Syntrophomonadaceae bacterium]